MRKLRWHTVMSLDGFIAGPDGEMGWAIGTETGSGDTVAEVVRSTGALLVGRRTQDVEDRDQPVSTEVRPRALLRVAPRSPASLRW